jgi:hypothetical protein
LRFYAEQLSVRSAARMVPCVVGVTHMDETESADLRPYRELLQTYPLPGQSGPVPVMAVDARDRGDVRCVLLAMASMLEMNSRFPVKQADTRAWV